MPIPERLDTDPSARLAAEVRTRHAWDATYRERKTPLFVDNRPGPR